MEKNEQINTVLGSALLFTIITSTFSLPNKLSTLILTKSGFNTFINRDCLWLMVVLVIIIGLIMYIKKSNQKGLAILQNENIRLTTGVLVALQGLIELSSSLPMYIGSIQASLQIPHSVGKDIEVMSSKTILIDIISVVVIICQILYGVYFTKYYKKRTS